MATIHIKSQKYEVYQQEICPACLHLLVNGESDHTPEELREFKATLDQWAKEKYYPAGKTQQTESYFSCSKCDLCNGLAGDRFTYNFFDKNKEN